MTPVYQVLLICGLVIFALLTISLLKKEQSEGLKIFLFTGIVLATSISTLYLSINTIIKNHRSQTGGPVHWHADFEIFSCGEKVDLVDPVGLSNRIGTLELHEHGDNRIHVEGTIAKLSDVSLGRFFQVIGGELGRNYLRVPTNDGELIMQDGRSCPDGRKGTLQIFVYQTNDHAISQKKLTSFSDYVLSPYGPIPPGDCIIFEFTPDIKNKTDKMCDFYKIGIQEGKYQYEN